MKLPKQYFRAGAGAVIINDDGLVLALERADVPGAWQFPQGGLKRNEEPAAAVQREIHEETGIAPDHLELIDTYPEPLAYELPPAARTAKTGRGQTQYWYLFRFIGTDRDIDLSACDEFRTWRWMPMADLLANVAPFRAGVYQHLATRFADHLSI